MRARGTEVAAALRECALLYFPSYISLPRSLFVSKRILAATRYFHGSTVYESNYPRRIARKLLRGYERNRTRAYRKQRNVRIADYSLRYYYGKATLLLSGSEVSYLFSGSSVTAVRDDRFRLRDRLSVFPWKLAAAAAAAATRVLLFRV